MHKLIAGGILGSIELWLCQPGYSDETRSKVLLKQWVGWCTHPLKPMKSIFINVHMNIKIAYNNYFICFKD